MGSIDRSQSPPRFTSFPTTCDTEASSIAGPSRRPPPTFSSFPAAAASDQSLKRSKEDCLDRHRGPRQHRTRHDNIKSDRRHRNRDSDRSPRARRKEDDQSGKDSQYVAPKETHEEGQGMGSLGRRHIPYISHHMDTVRQCQDGRLVANSHQDLDRSGLFS